MTRVGLLFFWKSLSYFIRFPRIGSRKACGRISFKIAFLLWQWYLWVNNGIIKYVVKEKKFFLFLLTIILFLIYFYYESQTAYIQCTYVTHYFISSHRPYELVCWVTIFYVRDSQFKLPCGGWICHPYKLSSTTPSKFEIYFKVEVSRTTVPRTILFLVIR